MAAHRSDTYTQDFPAINDAAVKQNASRSRNRNRRAARPAAKNDTQNSPKDLAPRRASSKRVKFSKQNELARELEEHFAQTSLKEHHDKRQQTEFERRFGGPRQRGRPPVHLPPPRSRTPPHEGSVASEISTVSSVTSEDAAPLASPVKVLVPYTQSVSPPPTFPRDDVIPRIAQQIEYYFSEKNLSRDMYLRSKMDRLGYVELGVIMAFPKLAMIQPSMETVVTALRRSTRVELSLDMQKVRPIVDPYKWPMVPEEEDPDQSEVPQPANAATLRPEAENFVPGQPYHIPDLEVDFSQMAIYSDNVFLQNGEGIIYDPAVYPVYNNAEVGSYDPVSLEIPYQGLASPPMLYSGPSSPPDSSYATFYAANGMSPYTYVHPMGLMAPYATTDPISVVAQVPPEGTGIQDVSPANGGASASEGECVAAQDEEADLNCGVGGETSKDLSGEVSSVANDDSSLAVEGETSATANGVQATKVSRHNSTDSPASLLKISTDSPPPSVTDASIPAASSPVSRTVDAYAVSRCYQNCGGLPSYNSGLVMNPAWMRPVYGFSNQGADYDYHSVPITVGQEGLVQR